MNYSKVIAQLTGCLFLLHSMSVVAQDSVGVFESNSDVGDPKIKGSTVYQDDQSYTLKAGGYNIWFDRDEFHYAYRKVRGNFILTGNFTFTSEGTNPHRKMGWMIRESLNDNAAHLSAAVHGDGLTVVQWRPAQGESMRDPEDQVRAPKRDYQILQLEREGTTITMKAAMPGEPLQEIGSQTMTNLPNEVFVGIFLTAHDENAIEEAKAWNVRIDKPVANDYNANVDGWIGSRLEILNVFTGNRKIIHQSNGRFEAPNWMPDGGRLLFNEGGALYTIDTAGGNKEQLNTGFADRNNNDHGISFDGKLLAISHHVEGKPHGGSRIYVLPVEGGEPRAVTEKNTFLLAWLVAR